MFKRKICYTEMTKFIPVHSTYSNISLSNSMHCATRVRRYATFTWDDLHISLHRQQHPECETAIRLTYPSFFRKLHFIQPPKQESNGVREENYKPDSNSSMLVTIQNKAYHHLNFFSHNDLYYQLPKHWPFLMNHLYTEDSCMTRPAVSTWSLVRQNYNITIIQYLKAVTATKVIQSSQAINQISVEPTLNVQRPSLSTLLGNDVTWFQDDGEKQKFSETWDICSNTIWLVNWQHFITVTMHSAECSGTVISNSALYVGSPRFHILKKCCTLLIEAFHCFQYPYITARAGHNCFHSHCFPINHSQSLQHFTLYGKTYHVLKH